MRGLKLTNDQGQGTLQLSHLLQMRGLKLGSSLGCTVPTVASFTDAWIETSNPKRCVPYFQSHLLQMRGLKLCSNGALLASTVASFTDAWIETTVATRTAAILKSHLLQMRGLKHFYWFRVRASIGRIFYRCVD